MRPCCPRSRSAEPRGWSKSLEILKQKAAPEDRELRPRLRARGLRGDPGPRRPGPVPTGPGRAPARRSSASWPARCPPRTSSTGACPASTWSRATRWKRSRRRWARGNGLPHETTVVETHTLDAPFIFESLKNYFRKAGLRVFSAVHPIFTVRRQWERIVWIGGAPRGGLERGLLPLPDRARGLQGAAAPHRARDLLGPEVPCSLAVEDFQDMRRTRARDLAGRLRSRRGDEEERSRPRAPSWTGCSEDNYIFRAP